MHCIDLKTGKINETLELPSQASGITLFNNQFILNYNQGIKTHPGIYIYDKNNLTTKVLNDIAVHKVFYSGDFIIYSSGRYPNFKLEIIL